MDMNFRAISDVTLSICQPGLCARKDRLEGIRRAGVEPEADGDDQVDEKKDESLHPAATVSTVHLRLTWTSRRRWSG